MKTIEEKAKAYDEAIERAKTIIKCDKIYIYTVKDSLESIFPELCESEDERIRKALVALVEWAECFSESGITHEESKVLLAWLEKQSEETMIEALRTEYEKGRADVLATIELSEEDALEKQSEQKPNILQDAFDKSKKDYTLEEKNKASDYAESILPTSVIYGESEEEYKLHTIIEAAFIAGQNEQKLANKVEPKFKVGDTMRTLQEANDGYTDGMPVVVSIDNEYYHCTNELIAIKDQDDYEYPPMNRATAWSEEDKKHVESILKRLDGMCKKGATFTETRFAVNQDMDWLKSLRPQHHWKPKGHEIGCLRYMIDTSTIGEIDKNIVKGLYEQLKQL